VVKHRYDQVIGDAAKLRQLRSLKHQVYDREDKAKPILRAIFQCQALTGLFFSEG